MSSRRSRGSGANGRKHWAFSAKRTSIVIFDHEGRPRHECVRVGVDLAEWSRLARKFARDREHLARTAIFLSALAEVVEPSIEVDILTDAPDNRILECAIGANAELIVTGDSAMLALGTYGNIRIVTLSDYLASTR